MNYGTTQEKRKIPVKSYFTEDEKKILVREFATRELSLKIRELILAEASKRRRARRRSEA